MQDGTFGTMTEVDTVEAMVERIAPSHAVLSQNDVSKAQVLAVMVPEYLRKNSKNVCGELWVAPGIDHLWIRPDADVAQF